MKKGIALYEVLLIFVIFGMVALVVFMATTEEKEEARMSELEKNSKTFEQRRTIGEFLDWLNEKEILLSTYIKFKNYAERLAPIPKNRQELLDEYFDIDPVQLDKERRELLEQARVEDLKEGWDKILNVESQRMTRKRHYFKDGSSLCGKYVLFNSSVLEKFIGSFSVGCCKKCLELWRKR